MLTSEFNIELAALIRRLEQRVKDEPGLSSAPNFTPQQIGATLDHIERSIITLVRLHIELRRQDD